MTLCVVEPCGIDLRCLGDGQSRVALTLGVRVAGQSCVELTLGVWVDG